MTLPPGRRRAPGFPRFGTHLPAAATAAGRSGAEITGAGIEPFSLPPAGLAALPRREMTAGLHCVAGRSATGLRWEGVPFAALHRLLIEPRLRPGWSVRRLHRLVTGPVAFPSARGGEGDRR